MILHVSFAAGCAGSWTSPFPNLTISPPTTSGSGMGGVKCAANEETLGDQIIFMSGGMEKKRDRNCRQKRWGQDMPRITLQLRHEKIVRPLWRDFATKFGPSSSTRLWISHMLRVYSCHGETIMWSLVWKTAFRSCLDRPSVSFEVRRNIISWPARL